MPVSESERFAMKFPSEESAPAPQTTTGASGAKGESGDIHIGSAEIASFQKALTGWFRSCGRDYPWRRTRDPYAILVSEAMLQQTRIATVVERGYFTRWIAAFPGWRELASADEEQVLKLWEGLGYYNRARNLQKAAVTVVRDHGGELPARLDAILSLPGVGRYTAGAVLSFAFNKRAAIVDGNVSRVFSRLFACEVPVDTADGLRLAWERAERLTPSRESRVYNSAVMELGQRICTRSSPDCSACPVESSCRARRQERVGDFPVKKVRKKITALEERVILAIRGGMVLLCPESGTRRKGLWRLPETSGDGSADLEEMLRFDYTITRYRVSLRVFPAPPGGVRESDWAGARWFSLFPEEKLPPLGSPYRKALRLFSEIRGARI